MEPEGAVFVVDDDSAVGKFLSRLIESVDLSAREFCTAKELLDGSDPGTGGCLVLDVRMPGMELQRQLATQGVTIPIIMITGQRASDHLPKPPPDAS